MNREVNKPMAVDHGLIGNNPCRKVRKLRLDNQRIRYLSPQKVAFQNAAEMMFAEHDHMVYALATNRADYSFDIWILPGTSYSGDRLLNLHPRHSLAELFAVDLIVMKPSIRKFSM